MNILDIQMHIMHVLTIGGDKDVTWKCDKNEIMQHCCGTARTQCETMNIEVFNTKRNNSLTVQKKHGQER